MKEGNLPGYLAYNYAMTTYAETRLPLLQADIRHLIPHADRMCLLHEVRCWNDAEIECFAVSHRALDNPLRYNDALPVHAGVEYCAQAIAVHGRLTRQKTGQPRRGYLVVLLNTEWHVQRLDDCASELCVTAKKQIVLQQGVNYTFAIQHEGHTLLTGQAVVALE